MIMSNPQSRCEFQDLPEATQVETPFGRMFVHHMFDSVNRSVRIDCTEGSGGFSPIVVNRVKMLASLRLTDYGKGFVPSKDNDNTGRDHGNDYHALHATRAETVINDVSDAAKTKIRAALPGIVNAWAEGKGEEFAEAARATIHNGIGSLQSRLEAAESEVDMLKAEIEAEEEALAAVA